MSSQPKPAATSQTPSDVFDMDRPTNGAAAQPTETNPTETGRPIKTTISAYLKTATPLHCGVIVTVAALIWVGWPYLFQTDAITVQPASRLMLPATADVMPRKTGPVPASNVNTIQQPEAAPVPPKVQIPQPAELPPFARALPPEPQAQPIPARRAHKTTRNGQAEIKRSHLADTTVGVASAKFSLNTVYAGQAWIQDDERTYVVQPGDTINGIKIISIDARERRVVTSLGVIR